MKISRKDDVSLPDLNFAGKFIKKMQKSQKALIHTSGQYYLSDLLVLLSSPITFSTGMIENIDVDANGISSL